jgi:hypothetical protein
MVAWSGDGIRAIFNRGGDFYAEHLVVHSVIAILATR